MNAALLGCQGDLAVGHGASGVGNLQIGKAVDPAGRGTSCMTRALIACPGLLVRESREELSWQGRTVPAGIASWANNPTEHKSKPINHHLIAGLFDTR